MNEAAVVRTVKLVAESLAVRVLTDILLRQQFVRIFLPFSVHTSKDQKNKAYPWPFGSL